jgi:hypothetical protein
MIFDTADPVPPLLSAPGVSFATLAGLTSKGPIASAKKDAAGIQFRSLGAKRAEKDDCPDDDDDDIVTSSKKKIKALTEDEDEDDEAAEASGTGPLASARRRERARCAAIFACQAAAKNPVLAANLAFNTSMPRAEAIALLQDSPAASTTNRHEDRAAKNPQLGTFGGGVVSGAPASRMVELMKKSREGR